MLRRASSACARAVTRHSRKLRDFIDREYLPACYDQVGWWQTSSGLAGYAYLARLYTTTDLTPQQIHEIGLTEVARIRAEMERVKAQAGFTGTLAEFFTFLRTDPRFFYKTGPRSCSTATARSPSGSIPSW